MIGRHASGALVIVALWAVAAAAVSWRTIRGVERAERSRQALASARLHRGRAPTPQWPAGLDARAIASLAREEGPLVLRTSAGEIVTAPVRDADDWDIIGAVAVPSRAGDRAMAVLGLVARARFADAAHALTPARVPGTALDRAALAPPSRQLAALALVLFTAFAGLTLAAVHWHHGATERPARVRETLGAWAFLAPSLLHLLVFTVAPVLFLLWISVHDWDLLATDRPFVGLAHFREIGADPLFWRALRNGLVYALYVPVTMLAALVAALVLDQPLRGIKVLRVVVFLPYVASTVAIALVWQWLLHRDYGLLNSGLSLLHLPRVDWLGDPRTALPAVMLVSAWGQLGYMMVVYLAGLQAIPPSLLEAARLDGANAWQRFRHVTWPMLRPVSVYLLLTGIIWSFHGFTLVYVMTEGGPAHATDVLVYRIYQTAWEFRRFDVAAAMSVVLCGLLLALTALQWKAVQGERANG